MTITLTKSPATGDSVREKLGGYFNKANIHYTHLEKTIKQYCAKKGMQVVIEPHGFLMGLTWKIPMARRWSGR
jgi:hypothetical protein